MKIEGYGDHRGMFPEMLSLINEAVSEELKNNQKDKTDRQIEIFWCMNTKKIMKCKSKSLRDSNLQT